MRDIGRRGCTALAALATLTLLVACGATTTGEEPGQFSVATGRMVTEADLILTEADAGTIIEAPTFQADIGLLDKQGVMLRLDGDDAWSLRWRFASKPDPLLVEWHKVDDQLAFETGDLIGDPATAAKVLEFRPSTIGDTTFVLELVEQDPANRAGDPAKRLEYTFAVCYQPANDPFGSLAADDDVGRVRWWHSVTSGLPNA